MRRLVLGCGYLGSRVARRWREAGDEVHVVTRSSDRADDFRQAGFQPVVADITEFDSLARLPVAHTVLFAVGHDRSSGQSIADVYVDGLRNVLAALPADTGRFIYISSTGVYGQTEGAWVDEESPCEPTRSGGRACLAAEQLLAGHRFGRNAVILRLAGIYGPGRLPSLDDVRAGRPIAASASGYVNLIHVDDAAAVVLAAARYVRPAAPVGDHADADRPTVYCVSDGHPVERGEFYGEAARQIAAPTPVFTESDPTEASDRRATSSKRIDNARMTADLGVRLSFPTFRKGLAAVLVDQSSQSH